MQAPLWAALACFALALLAYLQTLAPGLVKGDGGEFQYALATLGVPHPTGYPLYTLAGWLWVRLLPFGSIAWRINLLSAVFGAAAAAFVYGIVRHLTGRTLPALAGACFAALSPTLWAMSSTAEVYSLHALFVAALLYLLLVWRGAGTGQARALAAVAFLSGLSLSHHRTMLLLAPAVALFLLLHTRHARPGNAPQPPRDGAGLKHAPTAWGGTEGGAVSGGLGSASGRVGLLRRGVVLAALLLAGLLPYLHVVIHELRRGTTMAHIVFNIILGGDFVGFLGLRSDPLRVVWGLPREQVGVVGLIAAAVGLAWLIGRQWRVAFLLSVSFVVTLLFCLFYRVPDIQDFMIPTTLILAVWAGCAAGAWGDLVQAVALRLPQRAGGWLRRGRWLGDAALLAVALLSLGHLPAVQARVATLVGDVEARARALLAFPFESGSAVVADWELTTAAKFLADVEGMEARAQVMPARLWYADACAELLGVAQAGGTIYVAPEVRLTRLPEGYRMGAAAPYLRITREEAPYRQLDLAIAPQVTLEGVQREGRMLVLRWRIGDAPLAKDYTTYAHFFNAGGQAIGQTDKGMGAELTCWYPPTAWPVNRVTQDLFIIPDETTRVRVGLYTVEGGAIELLGTDVAVEIGLP